MSYRIYYSFDRLEDSYRSVSESEIVDDLIECFELIDQINSANDSVFIYLEKSSGRVEISFVDGDMLFELVLRNGLYTKEGSKNEMLFLLENIELLCKDPEKFGLIGSSI